MSEFLLGKKGMKVLLMGNEAIARGALEAGVSVCTGYPGNPSSEILDTLTKVTMEAGIYVEWSINEMVALEAAAAASFAGLRAMTTMKQNGVNVCSDFLAEVNLTGCKGGLVLVVCDDPAALSSGNEEDSRFFAKLTELPLFEPGNFQEAKDMMVEAFELSEKMETPCILRSVSRLSHGHGEVALGEIKRDAKRPYFDRSSPILASPVTQGILHRRLHEKNERIQKIFSDSAFNFYEGPEKAETILIVSGIGWLYTKEALNILNLKDLGILKLGTPYPFPRSFVVGKIKWAKRLIVIEETDPFVEDMVKVCVADMEPHERPERVYGKGSGHIRGSFGPGTGELDTDVVIAGLTEILGIPYQSRESSFSEKASEIMKKDVSPRPLGYCFGCPHKASFWIIKSALALDGKDGFVAGDIGCYGLGMGPTGFSQIRVLHCMGSGVGNANGFGILSRFGFEQTVVAVCGDSTFYHAAIPGLINAKYNGAKFLLAIMENMVTAMTGFQSHPGSECDAMGNKVSPVRPEDLCKGIGIKVEVLDPFEIQEATKKVFHLLQEDGVKVVVFRRACALLERSKKDFILKTARVHEDLCIEDSCGCSKFCVRVFGCPGNAWDEKKGKAYIDESQCDGCGLCAQLCPTKAIEIMERRS